MIHAGAAERAAQLPPLFDQRRKCVADLLDLARRQEALVASADYARLLALLGAKQGLIGQLAELSRRQSDCQDLWVDRQRLLPPDVLQSCERLLNETEALFEELLRRERATTESLAAQRDQTQRQLQSIAQGGRANQAYRDSLAPCTHRLLDVDQ